MDEKVTPDNEALKAFDARMAKEHLVGNWIVEPHLAGLTDGPKPICAPHVWRWESVRAHLMETFAVLPSTEGARRVLSFLNPLLPRGTTQTLSSGIQLIAPEEVAPAHCHSMNALRFVIEGAPDLVTVVNGQACPMDTYDLVLTPSYAWHDHYNGSDRHTAWLDVLDVTLFSRLNQMFFAPHEDARQAVDGAADNLLPAWLRKATDVVPPTYRFPWKSVLPALMQAAETQQGDNAEGTILDYVDPSTGGPLFPTMRCTIQHLRAGQHTVRVRRTTSSIYFVVQGNGVTRCGNQTISWGRHDTMAIPNWHWHDHEIDVGGDAILFGVHDEPVLKALGMFRQEAAA